MVIYPGGPAKRAIETAHLDSMAMQITDKRYIRAFDNNVTENLLSVNPCMNGIRYLDFLGGNASALCFYYAFLDIDSRIYRK